MTEDTQHSTNRSTNPEKKQVFSRPQFAIDLTMNLSELREKLKKGEITLISTRCGLSRATVSAVLHGKIEGTDTANKVLEETISVVRQRLRRLNYITQQIAQL